MTSITYRTDDFATALNGDVAALARADHAALTEVAARVKARGRAAMRAGGLSERFANALQTRVYPSQPAIDGAVFVFDRIPYAAIFETGGTIVGSPLIWLPLPAVPRGVGGRALPPALFVQRFGPLVSLRGAKPLLGGRIGGRVVPLYVGVRSVTEKPKFNVTAIVVQTGAELPGLVEQNLRG